MVKEIFYIWTSFQHSGPDCTTCGSLEVVEEFRSLTAKDHGIRIWDREVLQQLLAGLTENGRLSLFSYIWDTHICFCHMYFLSNI
jgi:hypothetical protein